MRRIHDARGTSSWNHVIGLLESGSLHNLSKPCFPIAVQIVAAFNSKGLSFRFLTATTELMVIMWRLFAFTRNSDSQNLLIRSFQWDVN
jgi:hypothetical protein